MRKFLRQLLFSGSLFVAYQPVNAQVLNKIQEDFKKYHTELAAEKIYVHINKGTYLTGEVVWFKLYYLEAGTNLGADLSKVAYAELLDKDNIPVLQAKIALANGSGSGSFYLPVSLANGNYKFRAYTSWMKNFGPQKFFESTISVINPIRTPGEEVAAKAESDLQFFPEGGSMLAGVPVKIGFKATGPDGLGETVSGVIINQQNDTVARFQSAKFGMGQFTFTPVVNGSYKAIARNGSSGVTIKNLPQVKSSGYSLHLLDDESGSVEVKVFVKGQENSLYLVVHSGKIIYQSRSGTAVNGETTFALDKRTLPEGISRITVFNSKGVPVSERMYFKMPAQQMAMAAVTDQRQYGLRKKVNVDLSLRNNSAAEADARLSVSVYRMDSLQISGPADIISYLWLTSELKGFVEDPGYYFRVSGESVNKAMDNLLLTQGWSSFGAITDPERTAFKFLPEYTGHLITGTVTDGNSRLSRGTIAYMGIVGKRIQYYGAVSDSLGRIMFNTRDFYGPGEIVVQTNYEQDSTLRVNIASPFSDQFNPVILPGLRITSAMRNALEINNASMQVQNFYSAKRIREFNTPAVDSSAFYGKPNKVYKLSSYTRFTTMEEVLREYVKEVLVSKQDKRFHIKTVSAEFGYLDGDPLVLLDGVPYFNIDRAIAFDPLKIEKLEVVSDRFFWGPTVSEGILSFTTVKGDLAGNDVDPKSLVIDYDGLQNQRIFYSPVYENAAQSASTIPDFRTVLYWRPELQTGTDGKTAFNFYTSDQPGTYSGLIQGISKSGKPVSQQFTFEVRK